MKLTNAKRDELQELYATRVIDDMSIEEILKFAYETVLSNMDNLPQDEFIEKVKLFHPDLLEE
jgi:hypothetical protein